MSVLTNLSVTDCTDTIDCAQSTADPQTQQIDGQCGVLAWPLCWIPASLCRICGVLVARPWFSLELAC